MLKEQIDKKMNQNLGFRDQVENNFIVNNLRHDLNIVDKDYTYMQRKMDNMLYHAVPKTTHEQMLKEEMVE